MCEIQSLENTTEIIHNICILFPSNVCRHVRTWPHYSLHRLYTVALATPFVNLYANIKPNELKLRAAVKCIQWDTKRNGNHLLVTQLSPLGNPQHYHRRSTFSGPKSSPKVLLCVYLMLFFPADKCRHVAATIHTLRLHAQCISIPGNLDSTDSAAAKVDNRHSDAIYTT